MCISMMFRKTLIKLTSKYMSYVMKNPSFDDRFCSRCTARFVSDLVEYPEDRYTVYAAAVTKT